MWYEYKEVSQKFYLGVKDVWTVKEIVEITAALGDEVYLIDAITGKHYSYAESNTEANKIANSPMRLGMSKGERVAI